MEGPYRDLGAGFARLAGPEGARRSPSRISSVEDALLELLRNARDAGARNIYVASALRNRRYRTLTVLDDGCGIPESHTDLIFEPGVTTRHLSPTLRGDDPAPHGAGLSLYHLRDAATRAEVASARNPTSITATFDTHHLPERSLQSATRSSRTNLSATLRRFLANNAGIRLYHSSPTRILATLLKNRIIQTNKSEEVMAAGRGMGLGASLRTVQRIVRGELRAVEPIPILEGKERRNGGRRSGNRGVSISLGRDETAEIETILRRIVSARYLGMGDLRIETRPGEISLKARVYEVEDEYE